MNTTLQEYISLHFEVKELEDLQKIASFFKRTQLKKGEYFLQTGKNCDKLSFIDFGILRIYVELEEKEITQWISIKGYFVTDIQSFIFNSLARWTIQALEDTELFTIYREDYQRLSELVPKWNELEKLFLIKCFSFLENRMFSHLSMSAEDRYDFFYQTNKELFHLVPQQYIASMLGMTPETFSRIRKKQLK
ncbi:MAG: Crp/Fnr family transcriptional regulator [Bacteroidetes bacterium]|nr:Crp/Fnr family transcriptional regulator [Bacteroidota bacterium]NCQ11507.1 Crp/Fnr family transcriptional regulator [Bacteroidota bacterium]